MYVKPSTLLFECVKSSRYELEIHIYFHLFSLILHFVSVTNKLLNFKVGKKVNSTDLGNVYLTSSSLMSQRALRIFKDGRSLLLRK